MPNGFPGFDPQAEIARLKADIARQETELTALEADLLDLRRELHTFQERYDRLIKPLLDRLEIIRSVIADLEAQHSPPPQLGPAPDRPTLESSWTPPPDYVPVEEQFRRAWQVPTEREAHAPPPAAPETVTVGEPPETAIKTLYRQLARRYHPDLTTDPAERTRRNRLMAEINDAYMRRDVEALRALAGQTVDAAPVEPLAAIQARQLRQISAQLAERIDRLKADRLELINSDLMALKLEQTLARRRGRDVLRDMAERLEREYQACLDRLDELRDL